MISIIAAVGQNLELGYKNDLIWRVKGDLANFRRITAGHTVVMGQKTYESLGRPLPQRRNIVITWDRDFRADGVEVVYSIDEAIGALDPAQESFIIGGGSIYRQFLPFADRLYLTEVEDVFPDADTYFPAFDKALYDRSVLRRLDEGTPAADVVLYEKKTENEPLKLGILGGLGPAASAYFYEMITEHTAALRDQDHIDILLSSRASTPDRTAFILGKSSENPLPVMIRDAKYLESCNVSAIVIPCNTAHYFIDEIRRSVSVPMPSIISETVAHIKRAGYRKAGILATEGTVSAGSYQLECERAGIEWAIPSPESQRTLMDIIYGGVKRGAPIDTEKFLAVCRKLWDEGCDTLILGCTELSLVKRALGDDERFTDSLEVLAYTAIKLCGHTPCGFGKDFKD